MYSNSFGYGVYKKSQVNIGNPYEIKPSSRERTLVEEIPEADTANEMDSAQEKIRLMLENAREEAQLIKREAEFEAERILAEAKTNAENIMAEVEQTAKEEGYRYGEAVAQQHYNDLLAEAEDFRNRAQTEYQETIFSLEEDIVNLALNIAKKVIAEELEISRDTVLKIASETINACVNRDHVILKVSTEDYDYVVENQERIRSCVSELNQLEIKKDSSLKPGSCIVDTGFGIADGSLDTKLEAIEKAFLEVLGDQKANG